MLKPILKNSAAATLKTAMYSTLLVMSFGTLVACDGAVKVGSDSGVPSVAEASSNVVDTAVDAGTFNTLALALQTTGLDAVLADESRTFTVFAPTDEAFAALGSETINTLLNDSEALSNILLYHVIADNSVASQTAFSLAGGSVDAANGVALAISEQGGDLFINDSRVISADVAASNGVIHVIDRVLIPAVDGVDPTPVNTTPVGTESGADSGVNDNGVSDITENGGSNNNDAGAESHGLANIVETAIAAGGFNTLIAAAQATGLDAVLADEKTHFTVFAPTDEAFAALGEDTINALLGDPDTLKNILLYHVIGGASIDAQTAVGRAGGKVTAANGQEFALSLNDGALYVNLSKVTVTDVMASNGVIHVIDSVLIPPAPVVASGSVVDVAVADGRFNTLVAALQATQLDVVLADHSGVFTVFAPTDAAFDKLGTETINALLGDLPTLSSILLTHVISGATVDAVTALSLTGSAVETASGIEVDLSIRDGQLFVNNSQVIITDIKAENGIIHVIDTVIQ